MTPAQRREDSSCLLLPYVGGVYLLRRGRRPAEEAEETLKSLSPPLASPFVYRLANCGSIEPAFRVGDLSGRAAPPLQKDLDRQFFRPCLIMDDSADNTGDARVMHPKECVQRFCIVSRYVSWYGHARCVHTPRTRGG